MHVAAVVAAIGVAAGPQPYQASISPVRWAELRHSYRAGCPVAPRDLRTVKLTYWGFDGRTHEGRLVVHRRVAGDVVFVFARLYSVRFPIRRMVPVSAYRGDDDASMAADNTSAFNCRLVGGTRRWSMHAYGEAIDVNPVENPYVQGARVSPPAGRRYLARDDVRPGMVTHGSIPERAFTAIGWKWGGRWTSSKDYQHFSTTGR
jgi:D-alanyl-D-alanine carboxypeptidase